MCMANNFNYANNIRNIYRRINSLINGEKYIMHKIEWCGGGLKLAEIVTKNVGDSYLNPRMKYIMLSLDN